MKLAEFREDARHFGLSRALVRAGYFRVQRLAGIRVFRYVVLEPDGVNRELSSRHVPYDFRILDADEIAGLVSEPDDENPIGRPRPGDVCYGILDGKTLASVGWFASRPTTVYRTVLVSFDRRYVYRYGGYTARHYRGQNLHGIGLARAMDVFAGRGYAGIVSLADRVNFAALSSCYRAGFRSCGTALVWQLRGRAFIRQTGAAERYGLRLSALNESPAVRGSSRP
ncbi:MAG: hypothetical protein ACREQQ_02855 [Candidatus Binatia bacterium]